MSEKVTYLLISAVAIAVILLLVIFWTRKGPRPIDVDKYRTRWLSIEQGFKKVETNSYPMSILNADKLLDQALQDKGYKGNTTAERMREATPKWSKPNEVWRAHKLRNQIAHEDGFVVDYETARRALAAFKQALKELGAI